MDDRDLTTDDRRPSTETRSTSSSPPSSVVRGRSSVVMVGPFGLRPKGTMAARAVPLARELARDGAKVTLVLPPWSYPADSGKTWQDGEVRIVHVTLPRLPAPVFHLETTRRLLAATLAERPDVVHCFKPKAYSGLVQTALWALQRTGLWRGRLALDEDDWEGAGGWNELEAYPWLLKQFFAWQETWGLRHADVVTVASRALERMALEVGAPRERVVYVPNGGAGEDLSPNPSPRRGGGPDSPFPSREGGRGVRSSSLILLYTRFFEYKVSRVLDVFARVRERLPQARLVVVGQGLFGEERELREAIQAGDAGIVYLGWPGEAVLPGLFAAADVALYPLDDTLVNRTKSPAKLLQLLSAGVPVVADAVGQAVMYVGHGEGGLLVAPGDVEAMAEAVTRVLSDGALRDQLAAGSRARTQRYYAWPDLARRLRQAYRGEPVRDDLP